MSATGKMRAMRTDSTSFIDRWFKVTERGSTIQTEIRAGIVTFLTMSYILLVNPQILSSAGLPLQKVVSSTALTSCLASFFVGVFAGLPVGIAPGMGLNAFFVFSAVKSAGMEVDVALACCFVAAIIVALLALIRALTLILAVVPDSIKLATVVGMGLLLSLIGLQSAHVVVPDNETLVKLGPLDSPEVMLAMLGLTLIATLHHRQVTGSIIIGIMVTALGYFIVFKTWPAGIASLPTFGVWKLDFGPILEFQPDTMSAICAYALVMIFDIGGALYGLGNLAGLVKDGKIEGAVPTYLAAAAGTALGAFTGTTPLIIAAESAVGIKEGGKTGLVAVTVSACFGLSLFFAPIMQAVPQVATAPVLVLVGTMMMGEAGHINWTSMPTALPAFLTMVVQPFTFSIANGIYAGLLFSGLLYITTGEFFTYIRSLVRGDDSDSDEEQQFLTPVPNHQHQHHQHHKQSTVTHINNLSQPLLIPGSTPITLGGYNAGPGAASSLPVDFKPRVSNSSGQEIATSTKATLITLGRRVINDLSSSPHFASTQHDLLIGTPSRPGLVHASSYNSRGGMFSSAASDAGQDGSTRGGAYYHPNNNSTWNQE